MPIDFPAHLRQELIDGWVTRQQILKVLSIDNGVRRAISSLAERMSHVAERRDRGKPLVIAWHIRPAKIGETPGTVFDIDDSSI